MATSASTPHTNLVRPDLPMMVHVTAPATLPAGYTFEAEINGDPTKLFTCEVVSVRVCFNIIIITVVMISGNMIPSMSYI